MKAKILLTALVVTMLSLTVSTSANAHPWHYRGGWGHPHLRAFIPPIPIPVPAPVVVSDGYYGGGGYYAPGYNHYYGNRYYDRGYYDRGYNRGGYNGSQRYYGHSYGNGYGHYSHHYRR